MALRNQPYIPLYIQDYLTDEKLSLCSWSTQGIYIKILCILHKQKEYGKLLFKQNDKQNLSTITNFAQILIRLLPCQLNEMEFALGELIDNDVLQIDGCNLQQKRMIKDGLISDARSEAAKKDGGNPNLFKQKPKGKYKQKPKQNTEDEYDNDIEVVNDIKIKPEIVKSEIETTFEEFEKMRIKLKKPMTDYAKELIKKELIKLSGSDEQLAIKILNQSIENSWQDVYPLKYKTVKNGSNQKKDELSEMGDAFKRTLVNRLNKIENGK